MYSPRPSPPTSGNNAPQPKILARACRFCRNRKSKCDTEKPSCGSCVAHNRQCVYSLEPPKKRYARPCPNPLFSVAELTSPRPSTTLVNALQEEKSAFERCIIALKFATPEGRDQILNSITVSDSKVQLPAGAIPSNPREGSEPRPSQPVRKKTNDIDESRHASSSDEDCDPSNFLSLDETGQVGVYGPTSALHASSPMKSGNLNDSEPLEPLRYQLIANAVLQRQKEHNLSKLPTIGGEPSDLAMHLLDLHWNRQHHTFLLTYRPAIMRDLITGGPYCSDFLLNAIFACVSKFSERLEVRDSPTEPETAGRRFFLRCEEMLARDSLLSTSSIPTLVGLLLLGSTFNARGLASKGWLYTGYAIRMVYDIGLHLDCKEVSGNAEDVEIRRRVFWGAFICDKLQSLYLGRPVTIQLRDAHVSRDFMDTMEENELWTPYVDSTLPNNLSAPYPAILTPVYSVSTFQQLCLLSKIMAKIVNRFYVIGATAENTKSHLQSVDDALSNWYRNLPPHLVFEPWSKEPSNHPTAVAPNVMILLTTYNALVILLHRSFIFDGHLRPTTISTNSWKRCTTAARNITTLASAYQATYSLRRAPYLLSYAVFVACTIHARNTAATESGRAEENTSALIISLRCLDELTIPNSGVSNPAGIIRRLMAANGIPNITGMYHPTPIFIPPPYSLLTATTCTDTMWEVQTPNSQELDALCRIFPPPSPNLTDYTQVQSLTSFGSYDYNSLNGLMDMYMPALNRNFLDPSSGVS